MVAQGLTTRQALCLSLRPWMINRRFSGEPRETSAVSTWISLRRSPSSLLFFARSSFLPFRSLRFLCLPFCRPVVVPATLHPSAVVPPLLPTNPVGPSALHRYVVSPTPYLPSYYHHHLPPRRLSEPSRFYFIRLFRHHGFSFSVLLSFFLLLVGLVVFPLLSFSFPLALFFFCSSVLDSTARSIAYLHTYISSPIPPINAPPSHVLSSLPPSPSSRYLSLFGTIASDWVS